METLVDGIWSSQGDLLAIPDPVPWKLSWDPMPLHFVTFHDPIDNVPYPFCPRSLLKTITSKFHQLNIEPMVGVEYEWYNFQGLTAC